MISAVQASLLFNGLESVSKIVAKEFKPSTPVQCTFLIGCWRATDEHYSIAKKLAREHALPASVLFTGGDMFRASYGNGVPGKLGPLLAEISKDLLESKLCPLHIAFQHERHLIEDTLYSQPTIFFPHSDMDSSGKAFYSGYLESPDNSRVVAGALRNILSVVKFLSQSDHHLNVKVLFFGGGPVASSEMEALLDLGEQNLLYAQSFQLVVLPIASYNHPDAHSLPWTLAHQKISAGLSKWQHKYDRCELGETLTLTHTL